MYVYSCQILKLGSQATNIDFSVKEALLQILIDTLVADLTQERHVRYTCLLLLETLLPIGLCAAATSAACRALFQLESHAP
jgi:hypothetical protein